MICQVTLYGSYYRSHTLPGNRNSMRDCVLMSSWSSEEFSFFLSPPTYLDFLHQAPRYKSLQNATSEVWIALLVLQVRKIFRTNADQLTFHFRYFFTKARTSSHEKSFH